VLPIAIVAVGAVSPLGSGDSAFAVGAAGERPETRVRRDSSFASLGLVRPFAARAALDSAGADRAQALLASAAEMLVRELDRNLDGWRSRRVALCIGSSAGGMPSLELALGLRARSLPIDPQTAKNALYDGPLSVLSPWFDGPVVQVLAACASSTVAIGLGCRWLEANVADLVIAGGYDALSDFVATGFEALGATTTSELRPFRADRDGMALGEGAALVGLVRAREAGRTFGHVLGFSVTNDAVHVTAPDPEGRGLARAANAAMSDAARDSNAIDLVSAHATATHHNDRAETRAIADVLGTAASRVVVHPFKAAIGHCLGASGALEALAALGAMRNSILPGALGSGPTEPGFSSRLLEENQAGESRTCLKLSSGFGGSNAVLVLAPTPGTAEARTRRAVGSLSVGAWVTTPSFEAIGRLRAVDEARVARLSNAGALAATAVASALAGLESLPRSRVGVVVGTSVACLEENEGFDRTRRERGPRAVEPRRFSRTSPNLPAGECAIAFGFLGPAFAVGGGPTAPLEALLVGSDLVAAGDADYVVVVTCDEVGEVARELFSTAGLVLPEHGARALLLGAQGFERPIDRCVLAELLGHGTPTDTGASLLMTALDSASSA
jgi:3-oxoacyl-[acyl-carrier-protein] synthase II